MPCCGTMGGTACGTGLAREVNAARFLLWSHMPQTAYMPSSARHRAAARQSGLCMLHIDSAATATMGLSLNIRVPEDIMPFCFFSKKETCNHQSASHLMVLADDVTRRARGGIEGRRMAEKYVNNGPQNKYCRSCRTIHERHLHLWHVPEEADTCPGEHIHAHPCKPTAK